MCVWVCVHFMGGKRYFFFFFLFVTWNSCLSAMIKKSAWKIAEVI